MKNTIRLFAQSALLLGFFSLALSEANAQWLQTVKVDIEAENAVIAKEKALSIAEKKATDMLLSQIAPNAVGLAGLEDLGSTCSAGYEVSDEKFSSARYLARIHQQFHKKCVISQLKKIGVDPTLIAERNHKAIHTHSLLLIAQHQEESAQKAHLWNESFQLPQEIYPVLLSTDPTLIFPLHDLNDQKLLPEVNLENLSFSVFENMARHYQADSIHLIVINEQPNQFVLSTYKINPLKTKACPSIKVDKIEGKTGEQLAQTLASQSMQALENCSPKTALHPKSQDQYSTLASNKQVIGSKKVILHFSGAENYLQIKNAITSLPSVHHIKMQELTASQAILEIGLMVPFEVFQQEGEQIGLKINENSDQTVEVSAHI